MLQHELNNMDMGNSSDHQWNREYYMKYELYRSYTETPISTDPPLTLDTP